MKHLFIAILFAVLGTSAYANDLTLKKDLPTVIKVEVKTSLKEQKGNTKNKLFRIQRSFDFRDGCNNLIRVWVSAPDGYHNGYQMNEVAFQYLLDHVDNSGCFSGN